MPAPPLSPWHDFLGSIERQKGAAFINRVVNDPGVDPWVRGYLLGRMDYSAMLDDPDKIFLGGQHGVMAFHRRMPGLFECHIAVLPAGRGAWTLDFVGGCLHWLFSRTDAMEVMARIPKGNLRVRALARRLRWVYEFTNPRGWVMALDEVPADIFSMHVQGWIRNARGLRERGAWFHEKLDEELARFGAKSEKPWINPSSYRHVGAALEMIMAGQPHKGVILLNRWGLLSDFAPAAVVSTDPISIDLGVGTAIFRPDSFWLATCNL